MKPVVEEKKLAVSGLSSRIASRLEIKLIVLFIVLLATAEIITVLNTVHGMITHASIFVLLLVISVYMHGSQSPSSFYLSLTLAPLIRILSLSMPLIYFPKYTWYTIVGIPVLIAAIVLVKYQDLSPFDIGLTLRKPLVQIGIGLIGAPLGVIEYYILKPSLLYEESSIIIYINMALSLIFFTGFAEELIFRGIMQYNAIKSLGVWKGILLVTSVFAILHIGWLSILDILFVFLVGLLFSIIAHRTGSIIGISLAHGLTNVVLFVVMPTIT